MAQAQAFPAAMCDGTVMIKDSSISVARPDAVEAMLGQKTDYRDLGGVDVHSRLTGTCDETAADETEALDWIRRFLSYLPSHNNEKPPLRLRFPFDQTCRDWTS